jgi:hypothetical protein
MSVGGSGRIIVIRNIRGRRTGSGVSAASEGRSYAPPGLPFDRDIPRACALGYRLAPLAGLGRSAAHASLGYILAALAGLGRSAACATGDWDRTHGLRVLGGAPLPNGRGSVRGAHGARRC